MTLLFIACCIEVLEDEEKRKDGRWTQFEATGEEFIQGNHDVCDDLDLLGQHSLYQYLCVAKTPHGKQQLAHMLLKPCTDLKKIKQQQTMIQGLAKETTQLVAFLAHGKQFEKHTSKKQAKHLNETLQQLSEVKNAPYANVRYLGIVTLLALGYGFLTQDYRFVSICFSFQLILTLLFYNANQSRIAHVANLNHLANDYKILIRDLYLFSFSSEILKEMKQKCEHAEKGIQQLHFLSSCITMRKNILAYVLLNTFFLWDFFCVTQYQKWNRQYGQHILTWIKCVGELESFASLAQIERCQNIHCTPVLQDETIELSFQNAIHPFLKNAIANDFTAQTTTTIITGSNMSGKTTFLRTIGLNNVLANCGANVCASSWNSCVFEIYTSMRIKDDVKEGISTFYGELRRIKTMVEALEQKQPMLVLIDEIFKGTNSADRLYCAKEMILRLHQPFVLSFISTHDFELCSLEQEMKAANYHFDEFYENDQICFDYKIKMGPCTSTNARQLMKLAGL